MSGKVCSLQAPLSPGGDELASAEPHREGEEMGRTERQSAGTCPSSRLLPRSLSSPGGKDTEGKSVSGKAVEISLTSVMHIYEFGLRVSQLEN